MPPPPQLSFTSALDRIAHPRRMAPGFAIAVIALLVIGLLSWRRVNDLIRHTQWVEHSHEVLEQAQALATDVQEAAAAERGYVLTGSSEFRSLFEQAVGRIPRRIGVIRQLVADNPAQAARLEALEPHVVSLVDFYREVVRTRAVSGIDPARILIEGGRGETGTGALRERLLAFQAEERALLQSRNAVSSDTAINTRRTVTVAGVAAVLLLVMAALVVRRDAVERKRAAGELGEANERLSLILTHAQTQTDEIGRLADLSQLLQACQQADEAYSVIERALPGLTHMAGSLSLINTASHTLEQHAVWGQMPEVPVVFTAEDCWALRRNRVHRAGQDPSAPRCAHLEGVDGRSALCVPLTAQGDALGVLTLVDTSSGAARDPLSPSDRERIVTATAEQIALALANLRLRDTLRSQTIRDPLTALFNRRFLEQALDRECRRAIRAARPLSLIMIDVDFFKRFNDTFGHDAGDAVLRQVGGLLHTFFRGEDVACRYGGEEFAVVLADTDSDGARARALQLHEAMHQLEVTFRGEPLGPITISAGVATLPEHAMTADALIRSADQALYRAKSQGRDRVVVARGPGDEAADERSASG